MVYEFVELHQFHIYNQEFYDAYLRESHDSVAILLCIQIINRCKDQMAVRKITVLNSYFDKVHTHVHTGTRKRAP